MSWFPRQKNHNIVLNWNLTINFSSENSFSFFISTNITTCQGVRCTFSFTSVQLSSSKYSDANNGESKEGDHLQKAFMLNWLEIILLIIINTEKNKYNSKWPFPNIIQALGMRFKCYRLPPSNTWMEISMPVKIKGPPTFPI